MMATSPQIYDYEAIHRAIEEYYSSDKAVVGSGPYVHGTIFSKGRGLRSFIRNAIKIATPLVKKATRVLKPVAMKAGQYALKAGVETATDVATDVLEGIPVKEAVRHRAAIAAENARNAALQEMKTLKKKKLSTLKTNNAKRRRRNNLH